MERTEKIKEVKKLVLARISLSKQEDKELEIRIKEFLDKLKKKIVEHGIKADIFLGGSAAKKTIIRKKEYDIDIFLKFDKKYSDDNLNEAVEKIKELENGIVVKGSRNYLRFKQGKETFEVIPITKVKKPSEARNVTDLSVFHVDYIGNCVKKNKKLCEDIKLAKAFVHASGCYGAESYVNGFSGYSLELLVSHYKSFVKFLEAIVEAKDKIILDPGKLYKNKKDILESLNESKLGSAIILVDPTFKERNALAALSASTFSKFKDYCLNFLKKPSEIFFQVKELDVQGIKNRAEKKGLIFAHFTAKTNKQEGDIAGSKLLKFSRYLERIILKYFDINEKEVDYQGKQEGHYYFALKAKDKIIREGPELSMELGVKAFKSKHKETYVKGNKIYAEIKLNMNLDQFFKYFQNENKH